MHDKDWLCGRSLGYVNINLIIQLNEYELIKGFSKVMFFLNKKKKHNKFMIKGIKF